MLALPSREDGPALLPEVPTDVQRRAIEMMTKRGAALAEPH